VRVEHHLAGSALLRLALCKRHEPGAESAPAVALVDPQGLHVAASAPGPSIQARDDAPASVAHRDREQARVIDTRTRRIERVQSIVEPSDKTPGRCLTHLDP